MGVLVPRYIKLENMNPAVFNNAYISLRFENPIVQHNWDGTYTIQGRAKVYQNRTDMFVIDMINFSFVLQKDQLNAPLHQLIYTYLKTKYEGATDAI
jgi:hypothetical protein